MKMSFVQLRAAIRQHTLGPMLAVWRSTRMRLGLALGALVLVMALANSVLLTTLPHWIFPGSGLLTLIFCVAGWLLANKLACPLCSDLEADNRQLRQQLEQQRKTELALVEERALLEQQAADYATSLSRMQAELARATRIRDDFFANMSHELRTPLNAILGLTEALIEEVYGPLNDRQRKSLGTIVNSGHLLLAIVNDVLDLSRIDAGKAAMLFSSVAVEPVCRSALRSIAAQADAKEITLLFQAEPHLPLIQADEHRLKQVVSNLLSNAVKFTPQRGQVTVDVVANVEQQSMRIAIHDTGIGIAPEHVLRLFRPFARVDSGLTRQHGGVGLGLALVVRLTDLHGGSVTVESAEGQGSCFTVTLPLPVSWEQACSSAGSTAQSPLHEAAATPTHLKPVVLLAESNEATLQRLTTYLTLRACQVAVARTRNEAVERAQELLPALILLDVQMPEMEGVETIRTLQTNRYTAAIPILMLTSLVLPGGCEQCMEAGAADYLVKPVEPRALEAALAVHLGRSSGEEG